MLANLMLLPRVFAGVVKVLKPPTMLLLKLLLLLVLFI